MLPVHSLPAELFADILTRSINFRNQRLIPQLRTLAQVCANWCHFVLSTPQLWRVISVEELSFAALVLKKNPSGPLIVRCINPTAEELKTLFKLPSKHANRWEELIMGRIPRATFKRECVPLLQQPTPRLKSLKIWQTDSSLSYPLSGAPDLTHVDLYNAHLPWDSPSLSHLKHLSISYQSSYTGRSAITPSTAQLIDILRASPKLESLSLNEVGPLIGADQDYVNLTANDGTQVIPLTSLHSLRFDIPNWVEAQRQLATKIHAPACKILSTKIPFEFITQPGSNFKNLTRIPMQRKIVHILVHMFQHGIVLDVRSWHSSGHGLGIGHLPDMHLLIGGAYDLGMWAAAIQELDLPLDRGQVCLELVENRDQGDQEDDSPFTCDHIAFWDTVSVIRFGGEYSDVIRALISLTEPVMEGGEARWLCPKLEELHFRYECWADDMLELVMDYIIELLGARWALDEETGVEYHLPVLLKKIVGPKVLIDRIRRESVAEGIDFVAWIPGVR